MTPNTHPTSQEAPSFNVATDPAATDPAVTEPAASSGGLKHLGLAQFLRLGAYVFANAALLAFNIKHLQARILELYQLDVSAADLRDFFVSARVISMFCSRRATVMKASAPSAADIHRTYLLYRYLSRQATELRNADHRIQLPSAWRADLQRIKKVYDENFDDVIELESEIMAPDLGELTRWEKTGEMFARYVLFPFDYNTYFFNASVATYILSSQVVHWFFNSVISGPAISPAAHEKMMDRLFKKSWNTSDTSAINWLVTAELVPADSMTLPLTLYCAYLIASTYKRYKLNVDALLVYLQVFGGHFSAGDLAKKLIFGLALALSTAFAANFTAFKALLEAASVFPAVNFFDLGGLTGWFPWVVLTAAFFNTFMYSLSSSQRSVDRVSWFAGKLLTPFQSMKEIGQGVAAVLSGLNTSLSWQAVTAFFLKGVFAVVTLAALIDMVLGKQLIIAPLTFIDFIYGASAHKILTPLPPVAANWSDPANAMIYLTSLYLVVFALFPKLDFNLKKTGEGAMEHLNQAAHLIGKSKDLITSGASYTGQTGSAMTSCVSEAVVSAASFFKEACGCAKDVDLEAGDPSQTRLLDGRFPSGGTFV